MNASKQTHPILKVFLALASISLLTMMIVITLNVIGRIFLNAPILGALEVAGLSGVLMISVALSYTEREKANVVVEVVALLFPKRLRAILDSITLFLGLIGVGFLSWAVFKDAFHSAQFGEKTLVLGIPTSPFKFIWALGTLMLSLFLLRNSINAFKKALKK